LAIDNSPLTFRWNDYRHHNQPKSMALAADEFLGASTSLRSRMGFNEFVTTDSWAIATVRKTGPLSPTRGDGSAVTVPHLLAIACSPGSP
jgi:hypothetical protein